jgi:hypothetical protein
MKLELSRVVDKPMAQCTIPPFSKYGVATKNISAFTRTTSYMQRGLLVSQYSRYYVVKNMFME